MLQSVSRQLIVRLFSRVFPPSKCTASMPKPCSSKTLIAHWSNATRTGLTRLALSDDPHCRVRIEILWPPAPPDRSKVPASEFVVNVLLRSRSLTDWKTVSHGAAFHLCISDKRACYETGARCYTPRCALLPPQLRCEKKVCHRSRAEKSYFRSCKETNRTQFALRT